MMKKQRDVSNYRGMPIDDLGASQTIVSITAETVQLYYYATGVLTSDAGQVAGTIVVGQLAYGGVKNALGSMQATNLDTSLSFTSTALTTEKAFDWDAAEAVDDVTGLNRATVITKNLANGEYVVDYKHGIIYGLKISTTTTLTSTAYKIQQNVSGGTTTVTDKVTLVAGTAIAGAMRQVSGAMVDAAGVALTPLQAFANVAASQTDSNIVTAVTSKKIRVLSIVAITGATATTLTFNSKPAGAGAAISPLFANGINGGEVLNFNPAGWFETVAGEGLTVTTGAGATTGILVSYVTV